MTFVYDTVLFRSAGPVVDVDTVENSVRLLT